jgi:hypothetical protein
MWWDYIMNNECFKYLNLFKFVKSFHEFICIYLGTTQIIYIQNYEDIEFKNLIKNESTTNHLVEWGHFKYLDEYD